MYKNKKILAIIPARGGSKRLPNKNSLELNGKPLITWTIEAALASIYIDEVYVSTDSALIKNIAEQNGLNISELRPDDLSGDKATTLSVVEYVIDRLEEDGNFFDLSILLQPTSPLRQKSDIDTAIEYFFDINASAVISVTEAEHSPLWSNILPEDLSMTDFLNNEINGKRSQDLDLFYRLNGAIYINDIKKLIKQKKFILDEGSYAFVMDRAKSIDIDNYIDFKLAELLMREVSCDN